MTTHEHQTTFDWSGEMPIHKPTLAEKYRDLPLGQRRLENAVAMERKALIQLIDRICATYPSKKVQDKAYELRQKADSLTAEQLIQGIRSLGVKLTEADLSPTQRIAFLRSNTALKGALDADSQDIA